MKKLTLDNGVRLLTQHCPSARSMTAAVFVLAGSRYEAADRAGYAHLVEHMVFKGTRRRSALDIANETDLIGGQLNAFTTKEYTCFYMRTLPEFDAQGLDILGDLVTEPKFAAADLETERGVVLEELAMYEDNPEDLAGDGIFTAAWAPDPLGCNIVGNRQTVSEADSRKLRAFHKKYYRPQNIVVAVSGRFDEARIEQKTAELFSGLQADDFHPRFEREPVWHAENRLELPKDAEQLQFCIAWPCVGLGDRETATVSLLNALCGGGGSSRLFQRLREQLGLAYSVYSYFTAHQGCGAFVVAGGISPSNRDRALGEIDAVLSQLTAEGANDEELTRAKNQSRASLAMGYENSYNLAMDLGRRELFGLPHRSENQTLERIRRVTLAEINDAARRIFVPQKACYCFAGKLK